MFKVILLTLIAAKLVASIEEPVYKVYRQLGSNAEIRIYAPTKWVGVTMRGKFSEFNTDRSAMFIKLFNYISGHNDAGMKINMTAPVVTDFKGIGTTFIEDDSNVEISMKFYIPAAVQNNTPNPIGENMFIETNPEDEIASIRFTGFPTVDDYLRKRDELSRKLGALGAMFDTDNFSIVAYDAPDQPIDRINEIWFKKLD